MRRLSLAALIAGCLVAPVATAQDAGELDTLPPRIEDGGRKGGGKDLRGVRIARPGALLLASFDTDGSMSLTQAEINAGARRVFVQADKDQSGMLSIFEQQDLAARAGSHDGPLANAMTFDANFDRQVSEDEFIAGVLRLASAAAPETEGDLPFSSLLQAPAGSGPGAGPPMQDATRPPAPNSDRFGQNGSAQ